MIPLVATVQEFELVKADIIRVAASVEDETGMKLDFKVGTMIELPRAVMAAGEIAQEAEFFSFGTNDLTQMTWGFSRDDVEASFFGTYLEKGIFGVSRSSPSTSAGVGNSWRWPSRRPRGPTGPAPRRLRRARRRPGLHPLLRRRRARLRVVLAVQGAGRPARGRQVGG